MATSFSVKDSHLPLGLRNNNPGNVRPLGNRKWVGQIGKNKGFAVFKDISYGIRAMAKNAMTQIQKNKKDTVEKYITAYAPPSENDTASYIQYVAKALGLKPTDKIPVTGPVLRKLIRIHIQTEVGSHGRLITDEDINIGLTKLNES